MTDELQIIEDHMKEVIKGILEKHLSCRTFMKDKVITWGDNIMQDIYQQLKEIYPQYGYGIFFYMSDITAYVSNQRSIYYQQTDLFLLVSHKTDDFYSEIRLTAFKKRELQPNFSSFCLNNQDFFINVNNKLFDYLSGRTFDFEKFSDIIFDILKDVNKMLTSRENYPCSSIIGYINRQPEKGVCFHHKFFDLEYSPVMFEYSNDSFICRLFLFLVNND